LSGFLVVSLLKPKLAKIFLPFKIIPVSDVKLKLEFSKTMNLLAIAF
jgi:hypothetical protein